MYAHTRAHVPINTHIPPSPPPPNTPPHTDNGRTKPKPKLKGKRKGKAASPEPEENLCLMRASNGKKTISTVISAKEVTRFQMVSKNDVIGIKIGIN